MDIPIVPAGDDYFALGCDSYTLPSKLFPGEYEIAMNVICRGGMVQTRPGSKSLFNRALPLGKPQGCTLFTSQTGVTYIVFAIEGKVYASQSPFSDYFQIPNVQFYHASPYIAWASCVQTSTYDDTGNITFLDTPRTVLIMQDGVTRAAYWDGHNSGHLNPTQSGTEATKSGFDETPIGLWMVFSNNRLWLSNGNKVLASDIGNPLKFTETQYLNEGRAFYLSGPCTGMCETSDRKGIICFTANDAVLLQSSIQDRTQWLSTVGFQQTVFPFSGCIAPRSIVQQYGLIWWYTPKGLINQNDALNINITSRIDIQDNEMYQSKRNLARDLSGVCGSFFENFLFHAVPNGDKLNTRIHVLDQAPFEGNANAWASYWTGWRPVEFARGVVRSAERVFMLSADYDGQNRIWELFRPEHTDNGIPITCYFVTRQQIGDNRDYKRFRYAEVEMRNILGDTAVMVAVAGIKGGFQRIMSVDLVATNGQVYSDAKYGSGANKIAGSKSQSRILRTQDMGAAKPSTCNDECVESEEHGLIDKGFSLLIAWSGQAGVSCYRMFWQNEPRPWQGTCEADETGYRLLTENGCGSLSRFSTATPFDKFYSTITYSKDGVSKTSSQLSVINQQDADRKATATAMWYVNNQLGIS